VCVCTDFRVRGRKLIVFTYIYIFISSSILYVCTDFRGRDRRLIVFTYIYILFSSSILCVCLRTFVSAVVSSLYLHIYTFLLVAVFVCVRTFASAVVGSLYLHIYTFLLVAVFCVYVRTFVAVVVGSLYLYLLIQLVSIAAKFVTLLPVNSQVKSLDKVVNDFWQVSGIHQ
jgi:hypothetical protein